MEPITEETDTSGETGAENWKERVARLEQERDEAIREKKGIYRELKEKEARLKEVETSRTATVTTDRSEDPSIFINDINARGKAAIVDAVNPLIQTILKNEAARETQRSKERALRWLSKQESKRTGKILDEEDVEEKVLPELLEVAKEHNLLSSMDWENGTRAAYEILESKRLKKKTDKEKEDAEREENIKRNANESVISSTVRTRDMSGDVISRERARLLLSRVNTSNPSEKDKEIMRDLKVAEMEGRIR